MELRKQTLKQEVRVIPDKSGKMLRTEFLLHGELGTVQFVFQDWLATADSMVRVDGLPLGKTFRRMAVDLGYHWKTKLHEYCAEMSDCDKLTEGHCYYDGSGLAAERVLTEMEAGGSDAVWQALVDYYTDLAERGTN